MADSRAHPIVSPTGAARTIHAREPTARDGGARLAIDAWMAPCF